MVRGNGRHKLFLGSRSFCQRREDQPHAMASFQVQGLTGLIRAAGDRLTASSPDMAQEGHGIENRPESRSRQRIDVHSHDVDAKTDEDNCISSGAFWKMRMTVAQTKRSRLRPDTRPRATRRLWTVPPSLPDGLGHCTYRCCHYIQTTHIARLLRRDPFLPFCAGENARWFRRRWKGRRKSMSSLSH